MEWAVEEVRLSKPVQGSTSKQTEKAHLMAVWKATGRMPPGLVKWSDPPTEVMYLWQWLCDLSFPLSYSELESWMRLTGITLSKIEIMALAQLDRVRAL